MEAFSWNSRRQRLAIGALALAAAICCWQARYLFLDDAFIHLRIAQTLSERGFYSFNGDFPAYCTSSPLYTALLALCAHFIPTPFLPKLIGLLAYSLLFVRVAAGFAAARTPRAQWLWLVFLAAIASPLAIRWLTDGMETGIVALAALALADVAVATGNASAAPRPAHLAGITLLGLLVTLLRVEFCFLVAVIGLASLARFARAGLDLRAVSLAVGAALGLGALFAIFGAILPDTAIAKAKNGPPSLHSALDTLFVFGTTHAAASMFAALIVGAWVASAAFACRRLEQRGFVLAVNAALPVFVLLVVLRQQAIQGYRYLVFIEFFLLAFNLSMLPTVAAPDAPRAVASPRLLLLFATVFVAWQAHDFYRLRLMSAGRGASFERFLGTNLRDLNGGFGIGWDVGFIGYFSRATILDGNGLVNGPAIARQPRGERLREFVRRYPIRFVFVNEPQLCELAAVLDVSGWETRATFDFPNFSGNPDRHFLLVKRDAS